MFDDPKYKRDMNKTGRNIMLMAFGYLAVVFAVMVSIAYVAVHFIMKFW